jgi:hypothetical protein
MAGSTMHLPGTPEGPCRGWKMTVQLAIEGGEPVRCAHFPPWPVLREECLELMPGAYREAGA